MQILLTEAEHDKLKSAAEGGELRAQELFKSAMKVYTEAISKSFATERTEFYQYDTVRLSAVLRAHKEALAAVEKLLASETPPV